MLRIDEEKLFTEDDYTAFWQGKPFTGIGFRQTTNGIVYQETAYKNGLKHGIYQEFDLQGNLLVKGYHEENFALGAWKYWYKNGALKKVQVEPFGQKSYVLEWSENGHLIYKKLIAQKLGLTKNSYWKEQFFYENGSLKTEKIYAYKILIAAKTWSLEGAVLEAYELKPSDASYEDWAFFNKQTETSNPFSFSK